MFSKQFLQSWTYSFESYITNIFLTILLTLVLCLQLIFFCVDVMNINHAWTSSLSLRKLECKIVLALSKHAE